MAAKKRGDLQLAAAKFRQAIRADSGRADAHWGLAWVLVAQGQKAKAISEFLAVRRLSADAQMRQEAAAAIARLSNRTARAAPSPPPHPARQAHSSMPEAGDMAPEVSAAEWINVRKAPSLSSLRGGVVLIEFWATWCGPCKRAIPHLNEIHEKYKPKGLHVVSLTRENRQKVEQFMQSVPISYPVGLGSSSSSAYGVRGIPHAYLVGKDGEVLWHGHPASAEMEREVVAAL
jgi:thiol-disulfide isomerase/thioredoxin